jgi:hypothetical protein
MTGQRDEFSKHLTLATPVSAAAFDFGSMAANVCCVFLRSKHFI